MTTLLQCPECKMIGFHYRSCSQCTEHTAENPRHYTHASGIETIDVNRCMTFAAGNAFKYFLRYESKGSPDEDLRKCRWYVADMQAHSDPIWIGAEHRMRGTRLLKIMRLAETNPFRVDFFNGLLNRDTALLVRAVEAAQRISI